MSGRAAAVSLSPPMDWLQALILGLVQGLTEFLPISSTAHLRVVPHFLGWDDPGTAFSAVIQLGTLAAVFAYFTADIKRLVVAALQGVMHRNFNHSPDCRMAWSIAVGTVPIAVLGLGGRDFIETEARQLPIIAASLIVLALCLILAERVGRRERSLQDLGFWSIQWIGLCQALALIPGCSRSGSTIMGGLFYRPPARGRRPLLLFARLTGHWGQRPPATVRTTRRRPRRCWDAEFGAGDPRRRG